MDDKDQANGYFEQNQAIKPPLQVVHTETLLHSAEQSLAFAKAHLTQAEIAFTALRNMIGH